MLVLVTLLGLIASVNFRKIYLAALIGLELLLLAVVIANAGNYLVLNESTAQILIAFIVTLAGAETSCALALIVQYYKRHQSINL